TDTLPADVEATVRKAVEKDPAFRFQSARAFYVELANARWRQRNPAHTPSSVYDGPIDFSDPAAGMPTGPQPVAQRQVAVLGFSDITGDAGDAWVGRGIAEWLTADLARVGGIAGSPRAQG